MTLGNEVALYNQNSLNNTENINTQLVNLWLYGKSEKTKIAYAKDMRYFLDFLENKSLAQITLQDMQAFAQYIETHEFIYKGKPINLKLKSQARILACVKSLLTFCTKLNYIRMDVGRAIKLPKTKQKIAERILDQDQIFKIIKHAPDEQSKLFLKTMYALGTRISEICGLTWADIVPNKDEAVVTIYGKGSKTRYVPLPASIWSELREMRGTDEQIDYVFKYKTAKNIQPFQAFRLIRRATLAAGITSKVSPHWFRHAHASHALEGGAKLPLIQETLGHASLATTAIYTHIKKEDGSSKYLGF